jgi:putative ABC transport system ATP-binding protein
MYTLTDVTKRYRTAARSILALEDVNLTIEDGEWLAVQGRTGSGKTTLLQMLGGLDRPTTGTVQLDSHEIGSLPEAELTKLRATSIGFIFQTFNLIPTLSALENVEAALVPLHVPAAERRAAANQALDDVGLANRAHHLPSQLSGGEQQRVGIARALVKEPKVLLADEPTGSLDEDTRDEIINLLEQLWHTRRLTFVLVTHDTDIANRARRLARMSDGQLSAKQATNGHLPVRSPLS